MAQSGSFVNIKNKNKLFCGQNPGVILLLGYESQRRRGGTRLPDRAATMAILGYRSDTPTIDLVDAEPVSSPAR